MSSPSSLASAAQAAPVAAQRNVSIDVLKLFLAFMVVGLHVGLLQDAGPLVGYLTGNGFFRIAVPIFLIINGFYFYPAVQRGEARRWFGRVVSLYLFWMTIYAYFWFAALSPTPAGFAKFIHTIAIGYFHLWYLSGMIGAALLMLVLKKKPARLVLAVALGLYCVGVLIQYAGNYHVFGGSPLDRISNSNWVHRNFLFLCFPFFYIGFAINQYQLQKRIPVTRLWWGIGLGMALLLLESYLNFRNPRNDGGFDNFASLLLICPAIFLAVQHLKLYSNHKRIALYSSGVYLVHMFVLHTLQPHVHIGMSLMTLLVLAVSLAITAVLIPLSQRARFIL